MTREVLMRPWVAVVAAAAVAAIVIPTLRAQSLAEVAERNRKKEAQKGKPGKVYTETDLRGRPGPGGAMSAMEGPVATVAASPAPGTSPAPGASPAAKSEDELRAEAEAAWRERLQKANEDVTRIQSEVDRGQTALNDISGPLYGGTRAGLIAKVEEGQRQLAVARQLVLDIQEEGRRARFRE